ncbi:MAG TPA: CHAT domain-containing protein, partial [Pirellulales bacterium]|nr:CHAT domain-containing protein [Pirellulales bacterium]
DWARRQGLGYLQVSLLELCAENVAALGQAKAAADYIAKARITIARSDITISRLGARVNYIGALASYQSGNASQGDASLANAMSFQRSGGSLWVYQISLVDNLLKVANSISARVAMDLYTALLRDPLPADWLTEPIEALSVMWIQHPASYESWFEVAIGRREYERALEISDLAKRHRFLSNTEFGGRLLNLRWMLEGPESLLDQRARLQKQDLLSKFVGYEKLARQSRELYDELRKQPLWYEDQTQSRQQADRLGELAKISAQQETMLREIALRREPADVLFPPQRSIADVRATMAEGQALLAFFCTSRQTHAFLMTRDNYGYWALNSATTIERQIKNFLRELGNWEQNKQLRASDLTDTSWKKTGRDLLDAIMKDSKVTLPYTFNDLIIVPDNLLWYVPFEALEVTDGQGTAPLLSKLRMRYAPMVSLGMNDTRPHREGGNTAVVLGRLYPQDDPEATKVAYEEMEHSLVNPTAVHGHMYAPSGLLASLADRLIVLADTVPVENNFLEWSPIPLDHNAPGSTLAAWMPLPWASPEVVILPGYHSAAENSLKKTATGNDLFMAITGLMATGARTVLISRWRPGGQSSYELIREFAQELPHASAADAWRRSVFLSWEREINPTLEPRLIPTGLNVPPKGDHPFFWSAFLLADTGAPPKMDDSGPAPASQPPGAAAVGPPAPAAARDPPMDAVLGNQGAPRP